MFSNLQKKINEVFHLSNISLKIYFILYFINIVSDNNANLKILYEADIFSKNIGDIINTMKNEIQYLPREYWNCYPEVFDEGENDI